MPFADQIETVGALAGLAAVIGLAVLALLYFAQAREVKRLREWAGRAPERAAELEQRVQEQAQRRVVAQPMPAKTAAGQAAPGQPARPVPGAPGQGAPATPPAPGQAPGVPAAPGPPATPGAPAAKPPGTPGAPGTPATPAAKPPAAPAAVPAAASATPTATPAGPPPATPAGAKAPAAPVQAPGSNGNVDQDTRESAAARPLPPATPPARPASAPAQPLRATAAAGASPRAAGDTSRRTGAPPPGPPAKAKTSGSPVWPIAAIVGGALAVLAIGIVLIGSLTGGDDAPEPANQIAPPAETAPAPADGVGDDGTSPAPETINRAQVNVAVLNGTTVEGLAREVANTLGTSGFTIGAVTNNPEQTLSTTTVSYAEGNRAAAEEVAEIVGVGAGAIRPLDPNTVVTAGDDAEVVVTVASDRAE